MYTSTKTLIAHLFRGDAFTVEAQPELVDEQLFPEELMCIRNAVPKRRAEFGTARVCAREALAAMGVAPVAIVSQPGRPPLWPAGVVGCISHTNDYCAVVLDRSPPVLSIGLDVEVLRPIEPDVIKHFLTAGELSWLERQPRASQNDLALLFFSAKEAYYKCQYPITQIFLEFQDVEVTIFSDGHFQARARNGRLPDSVAILEGRFTFQSGKVMCGIELLA